MIKLRYWICTDCGRDSACCKWLRDIPTGSNQDYYESVPFEYDIERLESELDAH